MAHIDLSPYDAVSGATISSTTENNLLAALEALLNGGLDATNLASNAAIAYSQMATLPPGTEVGYDQVTANVGPGLSTTEASGTTIISCAAHTFDGAPVVARFFSPELACAASATVTVSLFEGATQIGRLGTASASSTGVPFVAELRFTPSAGSHTYTVTAFQSGGNGTVVAGSGGTGTYVPAFIRFTKV